MLETPGGPVRCVRGGVWGLLSLLLRGPYTMLLGLEIPVDGLVGQSFVQGRRAIAK